MAGGEIIAVLLTLALVFSGAWMLSSKLAWRDERPGLAVFGDVVELPAEAKRAVGAKILGGGGSDNPQRLETHSGDPLHTDRRGGF